MDDGVWNWGFFVVALAQVRIICCIEILQSAPLFVGKNKTTSRPDVLVHFTPPPKAAAPMTWTMSPELQALHYRRGFFG